MVLTIGSTKGGVGKTTLAVNLAVGLALQGCDVLLVDGDEQEHALAFTELRVRELEAEPKLPFADYTAVALHGAALRTQVAKMGPRFDHVVIDVGGRDTGSLRAALTVSDLVVVPTAPRSFDLWGVDSTAGLITEAREINERLRAIAVLNGADPSGRDNRDALQALGEIPGLDVCPVTLVRRKAYPNAASRGRSVLEHESPIHLTGLDRARDEFAQVLLYLFPDHSHIERKSA